MIEEVTGWHFPGLFRTRTPPGLWSVQERLWPIPPTQDTNCFWHSPRSIRNKTSRHKNNFFLIAVGLLNKAQVPTVTNSHAPPPFWFWFYVEEVQRWFVKCGSKCALKQTLADFLFHHQCLSVWMCDARKNMITMAAEETIKGASCNVSVPESLRADLHNHTVDWLWPCKCF